MSRPRRHSAVPNIAIASAESSGESSASVEEMAFGSHHAAESPRSLAEKQASIGPILPSRLPRAPRSPTASADSNTSQPARGKISRVSSTDAPPQSSGSSRGQRAERPETPTEAASAGNRSFRRRTIHVRGSSSGTVDASQLRLLLRLGESEGGALTQEEMDQWSHREEQLFSNPHKPKETQAQESSLQVPNDEAAAPHRTRVHTRTASAGPDPDSHSSAGRKDVPLIRSLSEYRGRHGSLSENSVVFESQLYKENRLHRWKKRWVTLLPDALIVYKNRDKDFATAKKIPLNHSSVRELSMGQGGSGSATDTEAPKATGFEVLSQDGQHYAFCGDTDVEATLWMGQIKAVITNLMTNSIHSARGSTRLSTGSSVPPALLDLIMQVPENSFCADCKAADPDWVAETFGTFICITCSGIHRGLGRDISVVRSVMFDLWEDAQIEFLKKRGNKVANQFWECILQDDRIRPSPTASADEKTTWIVRKYLTREFVSPSASSEALANAVSTPKGVLFWIAAVNQCVKARSGSLSPRIVADGVASGLMKSGSSPAIFKKDSSASTVINTSMGKKAKKDKRSPMLKQRSKTSVETADKSPQHSQSSQSSPPSPVQPPSKTIAALYHYLSNPNLLKEALLYLTTEDEHFKRQLLHILSKEEPARI